MYSVNLKKKITTVNTQIGMHINDGSRAGEVVSGKSTYGLSSDPSIHDREPLLPIIPAPSNLMPSSGLWGQLHAHDNTYKHVSKTNIFFTKLTMNLELATITITTIYKLSVRYFNIHIKRSR